MRIAIVGAGTAGVTLLKEIVKYEEFKDINIDIYDNAVNMGQGVPFQNDSDQLLINLPARQMSINLDNPQEFFEWYEQQKEFKYMNPEYLPRFIFGHYMKSYLNKYHNEYSNISLISKEVKEIFIESNIGETALKYNICTSDDINSCRIYDCVFLTIGTLSYHDPYNLKGIKGYIQSPYPTYNTLDEVDDTDSIAVIGTGLASLDVIRYVTEHHPNLPITVTSRRGILPRVRGNMPELEFKYLTPHKFNELKRQHFGTVPLEEAMKLFDLECQYYNIQVEKMLDVNLHNHIEQLEFDLNHPDELGIFQSLLEGIKENMNWIWNSFSRADQIEFLNKYQRILKANSNPMPPRTAELIIHGIKNNLINIKPNLKNVTYDKDKFNFQFDDAQHTLEQYDVVINATGSKTHLADLDADDQLVINLENRQLIQAHPLGGIQIIPETNQVISPRYGTLNDVYALGQLTNGINQSRNGVMMIVKQAVGVVKQLFKH